MATPKKDTTNAQPRRSIIKPEPYSLELSRGRTPGRNSRVVDLTGVTVIDLTAADPDDSDCLSLDLAPATSMPPLLSTSHTGRLYQSGKTDPYDDFSVNDFCFLTKKTTPMRPFGSTTSSLPASGQRILGQASRIPASSSPLSRLPSSPAANTVRARALAGAKNHSAIEAPRYGQFGVQQPAAAAPSLSVAMGRDDLRATSAERNGPWLSHHDMPRNSALRRSSTGASGRLAPAPSFTKEVIIKPELQSRTHSPTLPPPIGAPRESSTVDLTHVQDSSLDDSDHDDANLDNSDVWEGFSDAVATDDTPERPCAAVTSKKDASQHEATVQDAGVREMIAVSQIDSQVAPAPKPATTIAAKKQSQLKPAEATRVSSQPLETPTPVTTGNAAEPRRLPSASLAKGSRSDVVEDQRRVMSDLPLSKYIAEVCKSQDSAQPAAESDRPKYRPPSPTHSATQRSSPIPDVGSKPATPPASPISPPQEAVPAADTIHVEAGSIDWRTTGDLDLKEKFLRKVCSFDSDGESSEDGTLGSRIPGTHYAVDIPLARVAVERSRYTGIPPIKPTRPIKKHSQEGPRAEMVQQGLRVGFTEVQIGLILGKDKNLKKPRKKEYVGYGYRSKPGDDPHKLTADLAEERDFEEMRVKKEKRQKRRQHRARIMLRSLYEWGGDEADSDGQDATQGKSQDKSQAANEAKKKNANAHGKPTKTSSASSPSKHINDISRGATNKPVIPIEDARDNLSGHSHGLTDPQTSRKRKLTEAEDDSDKKRRAVCASTVAPTPAALDNGTKTANSTTTSKTLTSEQSRGHGRQEASTLVSNEPAISRRRSATPAPTQRRKRPVEFTDDAVTLLDLPKSSPANKRSTEQPAKQEKPYPKPKKGEMTPLGYIRSDTPVPSMSSPTPAMRAAELHHPKARHNVPILGRITNNNTNDPVYAPTMFRSETDPPRKMLSPVTLIRQAAGRAAAADAKVAKAAKAAEEKDKNKTKENVPRRKSGGHSVADSEAGWSHDYGHREEAG